MTDPFPSTAAPERTPEPYPGPVAEPPPLEALQIPVAESAPLVRASSAPSATATTATATATEASGLPLKLLNELLRQIGATPLHSIGDLLPLLRILALAVIAGIALRLTSATLGAINELPLVGGLLELVGLVSVLHFLSRNAFKQQKRAELLARIQKLRRDLIG